MSILDKIVQLNFPETDYIKSQHEKTQVILHHTVSGGSAKAVATYWDSKKSRIATCMIIDKEGVPYQLFSSKYWGGHVGGKKIMSPSFKRFGIPYRNCSKSSIGIELVAWGGLKKIDGKLYTCYANEYKGTKPTYYKDKFRGYNYFDPYTKKQIETLKELLLYWGERYDIPLDYQEDIWDVSANALNNKKGIWSHTSFRPGKSDLHPQIELVKMLQSLIGFKTNA